MGDPIEADQILHMIKGVVYEKMTGISSLPWKLFGN